MVNDKIELRQKFDEVDMSDPSKLTDKDFATVWVKECMFFHGRVLEGEKSHYCPEWDFMPIDETCEMEIEICTCNLENKNG
jgi:hypothetical protein